MSQVGTQAAEEYRPPWHYKSTIDAARKMYQAEGIRAFYSGLTPALLGLTHVAIQFPLYEYFKMQFTGLEMGENNRSDADVHWLGILAATFLSKICATSATYPHEVLRTRLQTQQISMPSHSNDEISFRGAIGSSGRIAASSDGMIAHPKPLGLGSSSMRSLIGASSDGMMNLPRYKGIIRTCKTIFQEEGIRAFYNGMGTNMVRAVPAAMTTMITFEALKKAVFHLQEEGKRQLEEHD
jgi:solute carrier family 25 (mitochondrial folate transporter), member 32